jgi:hypothetical protein
MGTGATIKTGGSINRKFSRPVSPTSYYNRSQDPYSYGIVLEYNASDQSVVYTPLEDRASNGNEKKGVAYPFSPNMAKVPQPGDVVPLLVGPDRFQGGMSNNVVNQYDKTTYYMAPLAINTSPNNNQLNDPNGNSVNNEQNYNNTNLGVKVNVKASEIIEKEYKPALEKAFPGNTIISNALKTLLAAQTQLEGFKPGTLAYRTNNPGNVGTHNAPPNPRIKTFDTLDEGIKAQWNQVLKGALNNTSKYYKSNFSIYKYLSTYAPPPVNDPAAYTNFVVSYLNKNGYPSVTAQTTLEELSKLT